MNWENFIKLLAKKTGKTLLEKERAVFDEAIKSNPGYNKIDKAFTDFVSERYQSAAKNEKLAGVWQQIEQGQKPILSYKIKITYMPLLRVAAAIILILGTTAIWLLLKSNKTDFFSGRETITLQSGGQKLNTTLNDGTQVTLNKNSSIIFNKEFGQKERLIILSGEAFFDVTKNEKQRLIIEAGNIDIEVKGTAFNVNAYESSPATEITIVRGFVEVRNKYNKNNKVLLNPNQVLTAPVNKQRELSFDIITLDTIPVQNISLLSMDTLIFRKEKLKDLAKQLEKKYAVVIEIKNDLLKDKRFSGKFAKESIGEALNALKISFPFSYTKSENKIIIE